MKVLSSTVWGSVIRRKNPRNIWLWSPVGPDCRNSTRLGEIKTPRWEGTPRSHETSSQGKSSDFTGAWARLICWSWKVSWGGRERLWLTVGTRTLVVEDWRVLTGMNSLGGCHFGTKTWPHTTVCRLQCQDALGQPTSRAATQPHQPAGRLPNFPEATAPLNTPFDITLSTRGTRPNSIHQRAGTSSSNQEACTSL